MTTLYSPDITAGRVKYGNGEQESATMGRTAQIRPYVEVPGLRRLRRLAQSWITKY
jgi:hypothetical protein